MRVPQLRCSELLMLLLLCCMRVVVGGGGVVVQRSCHGCSAAPLHHARGHWGGRG